MNVALPHLSDLNYTVFGRVISGMEVIDKLQPTWILNAEGKEEVIPDVTPDTIKSIKILRKRDHAYEPNRVQQ